jgi:hypothetical protein
LSFEEAPAVEGQRMADRTDFSFRQRVTEAEFDLGFRIARTQTGAVPPNLREDTPLDPGKLRNLIVKGGGLWRATPDMRLVRLFKEPGGDGLSRAEQMLEELAKLGV